METKQEFNCSNLKDCIVYLDDEELDDGDGLSTL